MSIFLRKIDSAVAVPIYTISENAIAEFETSAERAGRPMERLRGLLKDELAEYGGDEAFIRWIREDDEPALRITGNG